MPRTCKYDHEPDWYVSPSGRRYCRVCNRIAHAKYRHSDKGRAANAKASAKYVRTDKGRATSAKYDDSSTRLMSRIQRAGTLAKARIQNGEHRFAS